MFRSLWRCWPQWDSPRATPASSSPTAKGGGNSAGTPVNGGTLKIVAASGPDHIDPVSAYYTADYELLRGYTRQLLSYPSVDYSSTSDAGWTQTVTPTADIATEVPTQANGGISADGKTYTFHIKPGIDWNSTPVRAGHLAGLPPRVQGVLQPRSRGLRQPGYYMSTISGLNDYCNAEQAYFANAKVHPATAANIAAFQNSHTISGIAAPDSSTIQFTLLQRASDFLSMLAMPFTSARPVEYDAYVPNSLQLDQNTLSDGP